MNGIRRQKKEIAEKIAKKRGLKEGTASYRSLVKSLCRMSLIDLVNLK